MCHGDNVAARQIAKRPVIHQTASSARLPTNRDSLTRRVLLVSAILTSPAVGAAQDPPRQPDVHEHVAVSAPLLTPTRESSGTAWLPEVTPMFGVHRPWRGWDLRLNGAAFVQSIYEPRDRHRTGGDQRRQTGSVNWGMFMARRKVGTDGRVGIRTMFSAEPWTVPGCGSPSFLATGEICEGDTIHDRQQQHDLVMELAIDYDAPFRGDWRGQVYAGVAGEPALGPPGYAHRASAVVNPIAPVAHHWLDAPVTFGLVTLGLHNRRWKAEASMFNGRQPDESRVDMDFGAFDSVAGRVSFLPTERLALQISAARLKQARGDRLSHSLDPVTRLTASAIYHRPFGANGLWATTVAYGAHRAREVASIEVREVTTAGGLIETSITLSERHTMFARGEVGRIPAHHLHAAEYGTSTLPIGKMQVGYVHHLRAIGGLVPGVGGTASLTFVSPELAPRYFGRTAPSFAVFFTVQAARHQM